MYQDNASLEAGTESAAPSDASAQAQADVSAESAEQAEREAELLAAADTRESAHLFREELARAMQAAADRERQRIEATVDEEATAHVEKVRSRAAAEAGELKRLAEQDVAGIRAWAKSEIERIRSEADVQIGSRRERLEQHLIAHATIIDGEIDRVSEAVEGYRHELDVFFARLAEEQNPSEIARLADIVPQAPDFEVIRSVARADAVDRLSALEAAADEAADEAGAEPSAEIEAPVAGTVETGAAVAEGSAEAVAESPAPDLASAEGAGEADSGPELVAVMDPALASPAAEAAEATGVGEAGAASAMDASSDDAPAAPVAEAPEAPVAEAAGSAGRRQGRDFGGAPSRGDRDHRGRARAGRGGRAVECGHQPGRPVHPQPDQLGFGRPRESRRAEVTRAGRGPALKPPRARRALGGSAGGRPGARPRAVARHRPRPR